MLAQLNGHFDTAAQCILRQVSVAVKALTLSLQNCASCLAADIVPAVLGTGILMQDLSWSGRQIGCMIVICMFFGP